MTNQEHLVEFHDMTYLGEGIGRIGEMVVFVPGVLPGEAARIRTTKTKSNYAIGELIEITRQSEHRVEPPCPYFQSCGGCNLMHMDYAAQLKFKEKLVADALKRIGGIKEPHVRPVIAMEEPFYYRNKVHFPIAEHDGRAVIGYFSGKSHNHIGIPHCMITNKAHQAVISAVESFLNDEGIPAYDWKNHKGLARHLMIRFSETNQIMVVLVINGDKLPNSEKLVDALKSIPGMASVQININMKKNQTVLGDKTELLWGEPTITDTIMGLNFRLSAESFFR